MHGRKDAHGLFYFCALVICCFVAAPATAEKEVESSKLAIDVNLYPYLDRVSSDTDLTVNINASLPGRFSYFSYMNFRGVTHSGSVAFNRSEQNLRWSLSDKLPIDLNLQAILIEGDGNDVLQLGVGWRASDTRFLKSFFDRLNLSYRLTFHLKRFTSGDDSAWQMEHFFRMSFPGISERLYLSGFLDQTFDLDLPDTFPRNPIVSEVQLGFRLFDRFYAITEYRINEFRLSEKYNLALGVEYKFRW